MVEESMPKRLGRYEIIRELGKGAMGVVYEGKDPNIGRRVAIKTARRDVMEATGMGDEMMTRFLREAHAAGALNHPNIITIYDAAEEGDMAYIAMEYLEGGDLADLIEGKRRLSVEEIVEIGASVCDALEVAHQAGVVHRDIKPANIMMPKNAPVKVADFGIARVQDSNLTQEGALIGTPHYMSPEQFMGQRVDGRSDLFSVGNILYELITGEKPFTGEQLSTVMHHVIKTDPVAPSELNFNIPRPLDSVVMKALSKRPDDRFHSAAAMAAALRECLKPNPDPAILEDRQAASGDATVIGGDVDATVAGSPPPAADATVVSGDATVAGPPPGAREGEATVAGGAPPTEAPSSPPGGDATVVTGAAGRKKGLPLPLMGGIVAVLVLVIAAGIMMLGGDKGSGAPTSSRAGKGASMPAEPYFGGLRLAIYQARTKGAYLAWDDYQDINTPMTETGDMALADSMTRPPTEEEIKNAPRLVRFLDDVSDAVVIVRDQEGKELTRKENYASGDPLAWPGKKPTRISFEVTSKGRSVEKTLTEKPRSPGDEIVFNATRPVVLEPPVQ